MSRELLQKAYVALDGQWWAQNLCRQIDNALAAPQPEPVARVVGGNSPGATPWVVWIAHPQPADGSILYAAPPAAPAPVVPTISPLALRALRMADMALASWENGYAFDSHGPGREAQRLVTDALALSAAPVVPRHVRKIGGSFQHSGTVVAEFKTTAGEPRIVLEFDAPVAGMLHVYRPDQVEPCESAAPAVPLTDEQFNDLVMEHLGPHALTGGKMSVYDAFLLAVRATECAHGIGGGGK